MKKLVDFEQQKKLIELGIIKNKGGVDIRYSTFTTDLDLIEWIKDNSAWYEFHNYRNGEVWAEAYLKTGGLLCARATEFLDALYELVLKIKEGD